MEVKVGQIWKNQRGSSYEITAIHDDSLLYKSLDSGLCGGGKIKDWMQLNNPTLIGQNERLSDLEIVQKALIKSGCCMRANNFGFDVFIYHHHDGLEYIKDMISLSDLLTWAKQKIGQQP